MQPDEKIEALIRREESDPRLSKLLVAMGHRLPGKPTYCNARDGIKSNWSYVKRFTPRIMDGGLSIMDVGPGVGSWMLIARELGNEAVGEDLPISGAISGAEAWISDYYAAITRHRGLEVNYRGFHKRVTEPADGPVDGPFDMIHSRGSLSGVLWSLTGGDHPRVKRFVFPLLAVFAQLLKVGGILHIAHNAGEPADEWHKEVRRALAPNGAPWFSFQHPNHENSPPPLFSADWKPDPDVPQYFKYTFGVHENTDSHCLLERTE